MFSINAADSNAKHQSGVDRGKYILELKKYGLVNIPIPCIQANSLKDIIPQLMKSDVILINEGQFFDDLYEVCINMVEKWNKRVHIAALDGDFKQQVFGDVLKLIPKCDDYIKLHALCAYCKDGTKAPFSHRISEESQQISIGVTNYVPLCRKCYSKENTKKDILQNYRMAFHMDDV